MWASRISRSRARNACECRNCGTDGRSHDANASSGFCTSVRSSRSSTTTAREVAREQAAPRRAPRRFPEHHRRPSRVGLWTSTSNHTVYALHVSRSSTVLLIDHCLGAGIFNFLLNAAIAWVLFRQMETVPLWGQQSIVGDTIGTAFMLPLLTTLIASADRARHVRRVAWRRSRGRRRPSAGVCRAGSRSAARSRRGVHPPRRHPATRTWRRLASGR
jgi:hypothetical protein